MFFIIISVYLLITCFFSDSGPCTKAGIHKMHVRIANREEPDETEEAV